MRDISVIKNIYAINKNIYNKAQLQLTIQNVI